MAVPLLIGASFIGPIVKGAVVSSPQAQVDTCSAYEPDLPDAAHFVTRIDNPYFPLPVCRTLVYRGTQDGQRQIDRVTVTSKDRVIEGVTATTVRDVTRHRGALVEKTRDWYA